MPSVSGKKRPAAHQAGPSRKKAHLEEPAKKKRSKPVTVEVQDSDNEESDADDDEDAEEEADVEMDDAETVNSSKPSGQTSSRENHKAQKALLEQRKAAKPHSTLISDAKRLWAKARQKSIPAKERQKHVIELMTLIRGKINDIVFKHDASRIVQTVVKYGGQSERNEIAEALKGKYLELIQSRYSKYLVKRILELCPQYRQSIYGEFQSHVLRLLLHRESTSILADAFSSYADPYERFILAREFYGKEATLFTVTTGSEKDKERAKQGLRGVLEGTDKDQRKRLLNSVKDSLFSIFNNPEKGAVVHEVVHHVFWEYLSAINDEVDETERERLRREIFECCQDDLADIVHTEPGSRVVREFLAQGNAKDRKQILKVLKPHIVKMCVVSEAQLVLFTALDVIDDTKLLAKNVVTEITDNASDLSKLTEGRHCLLYLIVPRSTRHFPATQFATLTETDAARAQTSKKDPKLRQEEIRVAASAALLAFVAKEGDSLVRDPKNCLLVTDIMLYTEGDKSAAISTLLQSVSLPYPSTDPNKPHLIDLPHACRFFKTLLQGGHFNRKSNSVEALQGWDRRNFADQFADSVDSDVMTSMCVKGQQNGTFVIIALCEALIQSEQTSETKEARERVKSCFPTSVLKTIENGNSKGKMLLLEQVALL